MWSDKQNVYAKGMQWKKFNFTRNCVCSKWVLKKDFIISHLMNMQLLIVLVEKIPVHSYIKINIYVKCLDAAYNCDQ